MQTMGRVAAKFSRAARRTLPFLVRRRAKLDPGAVSVAEFASEPGERSGTLFEVHLDETGGSGWATLLLDAEAIAVVLDGALGGQSATGPAATLSLAERALVGRIARSLGEDFASAVKEECGLAFEVSSLRNVPEDERHEQPGTDGLRVDCRIDGLQGNPTVSVTIGASTLEAAVREQEEEGEPVTGDPRMVDAVKEVPIEVVAELGTLTLGLRRVLGLRVGQVLRLPTAVDDPVVLRVAGCKKFVGVPVVSRGQLSVEIRGRYGD
ncbi:MAG TPA: FliM/FliN family flagellar motor switch protein [Polyangiaceae bacterium]|nr:FliM/FliN family flagellar motor switch protein [Polyangiaceae bacterium]